jgi:YVTN family beta-propeller protein
VIDTIALLNTPVGLVVDPDANEIYVTGLADHTVSIIDGSTDQIIDTVVVGSGPIDLALDRRLGRVFVANKGEPTISVISTVTHTLVDTFDVGARPLSAIAVDARGGRVYVVGLNTLIQALDAATGAIIATTLVGDTPTDVAVDSRRHVIFVTNQGSGTVSVLYAMSLKVFFTLARGVARSPTQVAIDTHTRREYVTDSKRDAVAIVIHGR